jgi:3-oxoacid CoA-transferase subunit B
MKRFEGLPREIIAMRVSREINEGDYVNLGIGIPTLIGDWIAGRDVTLQAEIGMCKTGPLVFDEDIDQDLINASCQPVSELPGCAYFDITESFAMIRGGHVNVTVMGAFQVSEKGDFAGWNNPARGLNRVGNIGGSMDLVAGAKKLIIAMEHTTTDGTPKLVKTLTYPATGMGVVHKVFTDLAVIEVQPQGLMVHEIHPDLSPEDLQSVTEARLMFSPQLREIEL